MLANPSFETVDPANPGLADAWAVVVVAATTIAGFDIGGGIEQAWEDFELGWGVDAYSPTLAPATTAAEFDSTLFVTPPAFESFEHGWATDQQFFTELGATIAAQFDTSPEAYEDFDEDWGVVGFATTLAVVQTSAGEETFDSGWLSETYATSLAISTTAASFDGASAEDYEDFDEVWPPVLFSANPTTNIFTSVGHTLTAGLKGRVTSTGQPPGGLSPALDWWVVGVVGNTFQLAPTLGGTAKDIDHQGSGVHAFLVDPTLYWNEILP